MFKFISLIILVFIKVKAEIFEGRCRTVEEFGGVVQNFDYQRYSGLWYEIER